jgi:hypothetical protein
LNRLIQARTVPAVRRSSAAIAGAIRPWLACRTMRARSTCRAGAVREWASFSIAIRSTSVKARSRSRRIGAPPARDGSKIEQLAG